MSRSLLRFEVYRSNYPSSELGERFADIEAPDHREAKRLAGLHHWPTRVVVLPSSAGRAPVRLPLTKPDSHQDRS